MSLTPKRKLTGKKLAANRTNGRKSRGAVTPEGKARAARANLRHGYYSEAQDKVLVTLGEDPADYRRMMKSLETDLAEAMEAQVVGRIGRTFWKMQRADRVQDSAAAKRVGIILQTAELMAAPKWLSNSKTFDSLCALARAMNRRGPAASRQEVEDLIEAFGPNPPEDFAPIFPLYREYWEAAWKAPLRFDENGGVQVSAPPSAAELERDAARRKVDAVLNPITHRYGETDSLLTKAFDDLRAPENIAALMTPKDEENLLMQRVEDSQLRQLWRLTNILAKIKNGRLSRTNGKS